MSKTRTIKLKHLTRVEGEGALYIKIKDNELVDVQLRIFESPRFFEALLRGRSLFEAPDITARICGICPIAYQMSAVHALEKLFDLEISPCIRNLRRLLYCGEWIESHALHIFLLHAPDFLSFPDVMTLAQYHPQQVEKGLRIKKLGNRLLELLAARAIHPINVRVGGFYQLPIKQDLRELLPEFDWALQGIQETIAWVSNFDFPDVSRDWELLSLHNQNEYPMNDGRIISNKGLDTTAEEFEDFVTEKQVPYSTALHATIKGRGSYLTGPIARFCLNYDQLSPLTKTVAESVAIDDACYNPYKTILIRCLEILEACQQAVDIIEAYEPDGGPFQETGHLNHHKAAAVTEAPRGTLYHFYEVNDDGYIVNARIIPPTSQNQKAIEDDLRLLIADHLDSSTNEISRISEQCIRNYDPCISCSTHFLNVILERI